MSSYLTGMNVLVTGASDGIGAAIAQQLAKEGVQSLILSGRDRSRLEKTAESVEVPCQIHIADLSVQSGVDQLLNDLADEKIDGLVNNAGVGLGGKFESLSIDDQNRMIFLNCQAVVQLSHALLPPMQARNKGFILFVGSLIGFVGGPGMTAYSGTKGFVNRFAESLRWELSGDSVRIILLAPGVTRTSFFQTAGISEEHIRAGQMTAKEVAKEATQGIIHNSPTVVAGCRNKLLLFLMRFAPRRFVGVVSRRIFSGILQRSS